MAAHRKPGIYLMEGKWSSGARDVRSVNPVLRALQEAGAAVHVRHHLNDREDLVTALRRWRQAQHAPYNIGYLALHGSPGAVHIGRHRVELVGLLDRPDQQGLRDKVLHFGSCSVLKLDGPRLTVLKKSLGVRLLTGFTKDVEWFESMAFELLLFEALAYFTRPGDAYNHMLRRHGPFADRLGFVMVR